MASFYHLLLFLWWHAKISGWSFNFFFHYFIIMDALAETIWGWDYIKSFFVQKSFHVTFKLTLLGKKRQKAPCICQTRRSNCILQIPFDATRRTRATVSRSKAELVSQPDVSVATDREKWTDSGFPLRLSLSFFVPDIHLLFLHRNKSNWLHSPPLTFTRNVIGDQVVQDWLKKKKKEDRKK